MRLTTIEIRNFRNLRPLTLRPGSGINWFHGPNGAGKTSVLEAIYLLGTGRSFRSGTISPLIQDGARSLTVFVRTVEPEASVGVEREATDWRGRINRVACHRISEFARVLPLVLVDPSNHALIEGGPAVRRRYLDWGLFHVEHAYLDEWRRFSRLLRQRNAALKGRAPEAMLEALEVPMAAAAARVDDRRVGYVERLRMALARLVDELDFRLPRLEIAYRSGCADADAYRERWQASRDRDREHGFTREGPHRGELSIRVDHRSAASRLSRGQMKLAALLLKLAKMQVANETDRNPVFLLDDPVSELDSPHLSRLLDWLTVQPVQSWITAVDRPPGMDAKLFHVEQGETREML